jgi:putative FmdB family regulatory protein
VPFYEYRCTKGHEFEVRQSMSDEPLKKCEVCGAKATRVLFAPAIHFKGTGFHNTDYASKRRSASGDDGSSSGTTSTDSGSAGTGSSDSGASTAAPAKESSSTKTVGLDKI